MNNPCPSPSNRCITYGDLLAQLQSLTPAQLQQPAYCCDDERSMFVHSLDIADEDFFDYDERDSYDPYLPESELTDYCTGVRVGAAKGTVRILLDY